MHVYVIRLLSISSVTEQGQLEVSMLINEIKKKPRSP